MTPGLSDQKYLGFSIEGRTVWEEVEAAEAASPAEASGAAVAVSEAAEAVSGAAAVPEAADPSAVAGAARAEAPSAAAASVPATAAAISAPTRSTTTAVHLVRVPVLLHRITMVLRTDHPAAAGCSRTWSAVRPAKTMLTGSSITATLVKQRLAAARIMLRQALVRHRAVLTLLPLSNPSLSREDSAASVGS